MFELVYHYMLINKLTNNDVLMNKRKRWMLTQDVF